LPARSNSVDAASTKDRRQASCLPAFPFADLCDRRRVFLLCAVELFPDRHFASTIAINKKSALMLQGRHTIGQKTVECACCHLPRLCSAVRSVVTAGGLCDAWSGKDDQLDKAGQTILQLVAQAAGIADENSRQALGLAQKLSDQLRAAEDRVAELESDLAASQERAERAEQWLHRIYGEIENRFIQQSDSRGAPQRSQNQRHSR
jgi:hypothetical protein